VATADLSACCPQSLQRMESQAYVRIDKHDGGEEEKSTPQDSDSSENSEMFKAGTNQGLSEGKSAVEDEPVDTAYPALKFIGDGSEAVAGDEDAGNGVDDGEGGDYACQDDGIAGESVERPDEDEEDKHAAQRPAETDAALEGCAEGCADNVANSTDGKDDCCGG